MNDRYAGENEIELYLSAVDHRVGPPP